MAVIETTPADLIAAPAASRGWASSRLLWLTVLMATFGIVMSTSAAAGRAVGEHEFMTLLVRRFLWFGIGIGVFFAAAHIDYHRWRRHHLGLLVVGLTLLMLVLVPGVGRSVNGARRWFRVGGVISMQPSELAKVCVLVWLAAYCERYEGQIKSFAWGFLIPMLVIGFCSLLILAEPDFGTALLVGTVGTLVLLVAGTRLVFVVFGGIAMLPLIQKLILDSEYRMARIMIFRNPWADPEGKGYQLCQSMIAIGSGGLWGRGLGGSQQKLGFLPECATDFVFSIVAEELGLIGSMALLVLFIVIVMEALKVALGARDKFGVMLGVGLTLLFGMQAMINIGVVTSCLPPKGLSLPLISAGGSSLVVNMWSLGMLVNIARTTERPELASWESWEREQPMYERQFGDLMSELGRWLSQKLHRATSRPGA